MPSPGPVPRHTFASLLDAQVRSAGEVGPASLAARRPSATAQAMEAILGSAPGAGEAAPLNAAEAFADYASEPVAVGLAILPACDLEALTGELQLAPQLTAREIERIRRDFALANHPDRVAPADRDLATRRMALANVLIDQALQGKRR